MMMPLMRKYNRDHFIIEKGAVKPQWILNVVLSGVANFLLSCVLKNQEEGSTGREQCQGCALRKIEGSPVLWNCKI